VGARSSSAVFAKKVFSFEKNNIFMAPVLGKIETDETLNKAG